MSPKAFILLRSLLAIALMIGFYALAFGMIAALGFICYEVIAEARFGLGALKVFAFCGIGMVTIFFSVLPRREEFNQPGPELSPDDFPALFKEIRDIAGKAGQAEPREVYLLPDMNAFVGERGGFLGFGRTRILGVGLPLLQAMTVNEVRAVLAHEFGHFHGGDTAIGPWIFKIRAAMARTLQGLAENSVILRKPFEWYGILFLRATLAVSRHQEYAADRLAASIVGLAPTVSGLKKVHALGPISEAYWSQEVGPAVKQGFRPRLAEGFNAFSQTPKVTEAVPKILASMLKEEVTNPYDSHPCLRDRIRALGGTEAPLSEESDGSPSAIGLVKGYEKMEPGLFGFLLGINPNTLNPLAWEESGEKVHRPQMVEFLKPFAEKLETLRFREYPDYFAQPKMVVERIREIGGIPDEPEEQKAFIGQVLEVHLILRLCTQGWIIHSMPGEPLECRPGSAADKTKGFSIGAIRDGLGERRISAAEWEDRCRNWMLN